MAEPVLYTVLWTDDEGAQCALYTCELDARIAAELVGGRVELRTVYTPVERREQRFGRV